MSRIHEALKKAEQERAQVLSEGAPAGFSVVPVAERERGEEEARSNGNGSAGMAAFSNSFGVESLLANSLQKLWKPDPATMLFLNGSEGKRGTEEFRTLRSRLYAMREKLPLKSVLVTSALPKEGKSFISANLAQVLVRQHGRRVLLIDADLRAPRLHEMLGTTLLPGLSDYLQGQSGEFEVMQRGPLENLFFIPGGSQIGDPSELVGNGRLKVLLQRVEPLFDWIILDSPPAIPVSDSAVLAKACDGVLLVVRSDSTPFDVARKAREEFSEKTLVGMVLNGAHTKTAPYTRYYYDAQNKQDQTVTAIRP